MSASTSSPSAGFLASLPEGHRLWLRGLGRSMAPLLRSGDALELERCAAHALRRGDVAVLALPGDRLVAHLVVGVAPLATATFLGAADVDAGDALARVVAFRRGGRRVPLTPTLLWWLHRVASGLHRTGALGAARGLAGALSRLGPSRRLRLRWLGPFRFSSLEGDAAHEAAAFAASFGFRRELAAPGTVWLGAWDRAGRLRGVAWLQGRSLLGVTVEPAARRLGVARGLLALARATTPGLMVEEPGAFPPGLRP